MRRMKIINAEEVRRTPFSEAANAFYKHCRVRNLSHMSNIRQVQSIDYTWRMREKIP